MSQPCAVHYCEAPSASLPEELQFAGVRLCASHADHVVTDRKGTTKDATVMALRALLSAGKSVTLVALEGGR